MYRLLTTAIEFIAREQGSMVRRNQHPKLANTIYVHQHYISASDNFEKLPKNSFTPAVLLFCHPESVVLHSHHLHIKRPEGYIFIKYKIMAVPINKQHKKQTAADADAIQSQYLTKKE